MTFLWESEHLSGGMKETDYFVLLGFFFICSDTVFPCLGQAWDVQDKATTQVTQCSQ